jgi:hypothetical protein
MLTTDTRLPVRVDLQNIRCQIYQRTGSRLRDLRVENCGNRLRIAGSAPSYYIKQLALAAILEVLGSVDPAEVDLAIDITGCAECLIADPIERTNA